MKIIEGGKVPIKSWASIVEAEAVQQLINTTYLPFIHSHLAVMPDVHFGAGATVGSVIPLTGAIFPCGVGVDISCGMAAAKLKFKVDELTKKRSLSNLRNSIEKSIPTGFNSNKEITTRVKRKFESFSDLRVFKKDNPIFFKSPYQLGTLGGGNHFVEVSVDLEDTVWLMLHSGSRNIGNKIAQHYIKLAKKLTKKEGYGLPDANLSFLREGTQEFDDYMNDLFWAQDYAAANREEMLLRLIKDVSLHVFGHEKTFKHTVDLMVNCHHNYCSKETHFGKDVLLIRKGAISAKKEEWGIIPGSMNSKSYIVQGLGNPESFNSASHGAGRVMSRSKAKSTFTEEDIIAQTEGVECRKDLGILDELPKAYKDISTVMGDQKDLVKPVYELKQILCIKG